MDNKQIQLETKTKVSVYEKISVAIMMLGGLSLAFGLVVGMMLDQKPKKSFVAEETTTVTETLVDELKKDTEPQYAPDQILVKFKAESNTEQILQEVLTKPQIVYQDTSGSEVEFNSEEYREIFLSPEKIENYDIKETTLTIKEKEKLFPSISTESIKARIPIITTEVEDKAKNLEQWEIIQFNQSNVDVLALRNELLKNEQVEYAEPNYVIHTNMVPNDYYYNTDLQSPPVYSWGQDYLDMWGLKAINIERAWDEIYAQRGDLDQDGDIDDDDVEFLQQYLFADGPAPDPVEVADVNGDDRTNLSDVVYLISYLNTGDPVPVDYSQNEIVIAVPDTGIDYNHEDLLNNIWQNIDEIPDNNIDDDGNGYVDDIRGWNYVAAWGNNELMDDMGHGTHVAGTIAAEWNNENGIAGVCPTCKIMPLKVLDSNGNGYFSSSARAIKYAADNGAHVVNMSFGGPIPFEILTNEALEYASLYGVITIAAAGNENKDVNHYSPASSSYAITVASSDQNDVRTNFSNWGTKIDVSAPGGGSDIISGEPEIPPYLGRNILSLRASGTDMYGDGLCIVGDEAKYYRARGTSMAAPHVAGLAGLILTKHPEFTPDEVRAVISLSADDLHGVGWDQDTGYGRINAYQALKMNDPSLLPTAIIEEPHTNDVIRGSFPVTGKAYSPDFVAYTVEICEPTGENCTIEFQSTEPVLNGLLGNVNTEDFSQGEKLLILRVQDQNFPERINRKMVVMGSTIMAGWPYSYDSMFMGSSTFTVSDVNNNDSKEIIISGSMRNVKIVDHTANLLYQTNPEVSVYSTNMIRFAVGNINDDPYEEVVFLGYYDDAGETVRKNYAYSIDDNDSDTFMDILSHWPTIDIRNHANNFSMYDVDNDSKKEVFFNGGVWNIEVYGVDGNNDNLPGWPVIHTANTFGESFGDLDLDGDVEIIDHSYGYISGDGTKYPKVEAWHHDDQDNDGYADIVDGFPIYAGGLYSPPWPATIGDVDGDNKPEIVILTKFGPEDYDDVIDKDTFAIYVFENDGSEKPGWPRVIAHPTDEEPLKVTNGAVSRLILSDLDKDGAAEIILAKDGRTWDLVATQVYSGNGELLLSVPFYGGTYAPVTGDVDGDGFEDIVVAMQKGVYAFDRNGNLIDELSMNFGPLNRIDGDPALVDIDGNGKLELIIQMYNDIMRKDQIMVFTLPNSSSLTTWSMINHDPQNTSLYQNRCSDGTIYSFCNSSNQLCFQGELVLKGDLNRDGEINALDLGFMTDYLFAGGQVSGPVEAADINGDGEVNALDLSALIDYLFAGGAEPACGTE